MKKLGESGANPTIQIDIVDLEEVKLEALARSAPASSRQLPPPLPPLEAPVVQEPAPRSNRALVVALVVCLVVGFGIVAFLRTRSAAPTAASPAVITLPTVDMNDDTPDAAR
jgi:hypothetical protein